jgi:hypothetical protein
LRERAASKCRPKRILYFSEREEPFTYESGALTPWQSEMSHFSAIEWVDFARGLISPEKANVMRASVQVCEECRSSSNFWGHVYELLSREGDYEPSVEVLENVKAAFTEQESVPWWARITDFATVVFDSLLQPALAGVRSSERNTRQITVESGAFVVDLQVESATVQHQYQLTGQILSNNNSIDQINGAEVVLLSPDAVVQKTRANESGEFCLDFSYEENLRLFIDIKGERGVGIMLPKLEQWRREPMQ